MDLLRITPDQALKLVAEANRMTRPEVEQLQRQRLHFLVKYARVHSPLYAEKYAGLPENPELSDLQPMTREEGAPRFEEWLCDREVRKKDLDSFIADKQNMGALFNGKYSVLATSGTTCMPLVVLRDERHGAVNAALMALRLQRGGKVKNIPGVHEFGCRMAGILAAGGFHSTYISYLRVKAAYEAKGIGDRQLMLTVDMPTEEKVARLNSFQPELFSGYPSILRVLARMQQKGLLNIHPLVIGCSAEHLSDDTLRLLEETFGCPVINNYCTSEAGEVAMLCEANHMHVNDDWILVEPVDADNRPVPPGTESDGTLMTNLANLAQPFIRYRVSDRIVLHTEPCSCGSKFPYIDIEGRKEDILTFAGQNGPVAVPPPVFLLLVAHVSGCLDGQHIQRAPDRVEIRYECVESSDRERVGRELLENTRNVLSQNGAANVIVELSDGPLLRGKTGKLQHTYKDFFPA